MTQTMIMLIWAGTFLVHTLSFGLLDYMFIKAAFDCGEWWMALFAIPITACGIFSGFVCLTVFGII
jgi:hypothetical protein